MKDHFEHDLDRQPHNWELRLVYADWLEDQGEEAACRCQRWMAEHRVRPAFGMQTSDKTVCWRWQSWEVARKTNPLADAARLNTHLLPFSLFRLLTRSSSVADGQTSSLRAAWYQTRMQAEADLAQALEQFGYDRDRDDQSWWVTRLQERRK